MNRRAIAMSWTVALAIASVAPSSVHAAGPAGETGDKAATEHFLRAVELFEAGDAEAALVEFQRAYELNPHWGVLYNIGLTQLSLGDRVAARRSLRTFLEEGADKVPAARRTAVQRRLVEIEAHIGAITVECDAEGATVRIDGEAVPVGERVDVNEGMHTVEVTAEGFEPQQQEVDVVAGERSVVSVQLSAVETEVPEPEVAPPTPPTPRPAPAEALPRPRDTGPSEPPAALRGATWAMLGVTAATGVAAIVTGALAVRADRALDEELGSLPADPTAIADARDRRRALARATDGLIGVTAVLAATTLGLGVAVVVNKRRAVASVQARF